MSNIRKQNNYIKQISLNSNARHYIRYKVEWIIYYKTLINCSRYAYRCRRPCPDVSHFVLANGQVQNIPNQETWNSLKVRSTNERKRRTGVVVGGDGSDNAAAAMRGGSDDVVPLECSRKTWNNNLTKRQ